MSISRLVVVAGLTSFFGAGPVFAQPSTSSASAAAANLATASRAPEAPTLDGDVLGDPAWAQATPITGFTQEQPNEGQPVSERTEVRVIFTNDTLYIGAVMYDSDPSGIIVSDSRRDAPLDDTDSFQMIVDTYRDRQNGFVFGTNPAGIEYDGAGHQRRRGRWRTAAAASGNRAAPAAASTSTGTRRGRCARRSPIRGGPRSSRFRSARCAIPRAPARPGASTSSATSAARTSARYWAPIPRQFNLYRLSLAGSMTGVQTPALRNLRITPYRAGQRAGVWRQRRSTPRWITTSAAT